MDLPEVWARLSLSGAGYQHLRQLAVRMPL